MVFSAWVEEKCIRIRVAKNRGYVRTRRLNVSDFGLNSRIPNPLVPWWLILAATSICDLDEYMSRQCVWIHSNRRRRGGKSRDKQGQSAQEKADSDVQSFVSFGAAAVILPQTGRQAGDGQWQSSHVHQSLSSTLLQM